MNPTSHLPLIGDPLANVDTPALILDLDAFEKNLKAMAYFAKQHHIRLRPHAKTHKCSEVARRQIELGAGGVKDVLVSNQVVGATKLARLAELANSATISLCFDSVAMVKAASDAASAAGVTLHGLVEIEVGMKRCGIAPGQPAADLAKVIANSPGLRFAGLQAYQGKAQHFRTLDERRAAIDVAVAAIRETIAALDKVGLTCETVTGAGTGTFPLETASGVYTELQAGSYAFMDCDYAANHDRVGFSHSLFILTTTMSVAGGDWVVLDAGLKSFSGESGLPTVVGHAGLKAVGLSDEHTKVDVAPGTARPMLGEKVLLIPGHCDPTINLHDHYVCIRDGKVEAIWPIDARGKSW